MSVFHAVMGLGWRVCADELEAVLAALPGLEGPPEPERTPEGTEP